LGVAILACKKKVYESGFTLERLEALEAAIAEGVLTVKYSDKEVTYQDPDTMLKVAGMMRKRLGITGKPCNPGLFGGSRIIGRHSKGLD
jgi:hypothetical protein